MKIYPFIVINKSDIKTPQHFKVARQVADFFYGKIGKGNGVNWDNWIVLKNEKTVIDWSLLSGGDAITIHRSIESVLNKA